MVKRILSQKVWRLLFAVIPSLCFAGNDLLPSWNEGRAKSAIVQFVQKTTNSNDSDYIPAEERIATFDQDGTLWVEQPSYTQLTYAIDKVKKEAARHPEWKKEEPYKSLIEANREKVKKLTLQEIEKIVAVSHAGITPSYFQAEVREWLKTAQHPKFQRHYTELVYQPMLELIQYLKAHGFKVYIVSGGGQEFIRSYSDKVYGVPSENVIGSAGKTRYEFKDGKPVLIKLPEVLLIDDKKGKPEAINLFIGKHPVIAFGNSDGDKQMAEWSQASPSKSLQLLLHHDDPEREYVYDTDSKIGTFSESLREAAIKNKWIIVSMKNDWKIIFPQSNLLQR